VEVEMSCAAARESRIVQRSCQSCRNRKARFQYRGVVRADRDHTLCFECYRSEINRQRVRRLAAVSSGPVRALLPPRSPFDVMRLSERQIAHRERMLNHLRHAAQA
jgi:hypothetical protein